MKKIISNLKSTAVLMLFVLASGTQMSAQSFESFGFTVQPVEQPVPTLSGVSVTATCPNNPATVTLTGLLPNSSGSGTYQLLNGAFVVGSGGFEGTSNAQGVFSFQTPEPLTIQANGVTLKVTSLTTSQGQTATFNNISTTLVVGNPTLGTVVIAPACVGSTTTVTLTGLLPNSTGTATYRIGPLTPETVSGTSDAMGNFTFVTPVVTQAAIGLTVRILSLTAEAGGCSTNFTNKTAVIKSGKPTLSTVTAPPTCAGEAATITLSGLLPNTSGTATVKIVGQPQASGTFTVPGTSNGSGMFTFQTPLPLGLNDNGTTVEITKLETDAGCVTNFTNKIATLAVQSCNAPLTRNGFTALSVYPNPARDILNISGASKGVNVEILNLQGQKVLTSTDTQINISSLATGAYIVRVQDAQNAPLVTRIIKN